MGTNSTRKPYPTEPCERAVRMVREQDNEYASRWAALTSTAAKFGCNPETLRGWLRQAERDEGTPGGWVARSRRSRWPLSPLSGGTQMTNLRDSRPTYQNFLNCRSTSSQ